ncbi:hypothetical protein [uncultured Tenacibaculum sp.]|uniref:hypothetical protein n=1 Tax=uncultured Tenacibaculum sp. TaxID=174713 RepID=UPI002619CF96|nr:hypothetical protein [uncultured Tenacibaculum sp.]
MKNLKFLLCIVVFVFTVSCTDNTEDLVTNTQTTDVTTMDVGGGDDDALDIPIGGNGTNYTGNDGGTTGSDGGKGN